MYILGYEIDFGHYEAAILINSPKFSEKYTGYIANDSEIYEIYNNIYKQLIKLDTEHGYIKVIRDTEIKTNEESKNESIYIKAGSLLKNSIEDPVFFNLKKIKYITDTHSNYDILCSLNTYKTQLMFQKKHESQQKRIEFTDEFLDPIMKVEIKNAQIAANTATCRHRI